MKKQPTEPTPTLTAEQGYSPPWRELEPDGTLGEQYGPTPSTHARHVADHKNWAYRPPRHAIEREDAEAMRAYMRPNPREPIRTDVPMGERAVYEGAYEMGKSLREIGFLLGVEKSTICSYLKRLRGRLARVGC
jgi:hypothetical protein